MFAQTVPVPLTEVTLPCSPRARAFRVSWKTGQLRGRYFFNLPSAVGLPELARFPLRSRFPDSLCNGERGVNDTRPQKGEVFMRHCDDSFAVFVSGRGRTCVAITLIDPRGNQMLRRQLCHTFLTSDSFVGWPLFISCPLTSPLLIVVDPIFENVPPIIPLTPGCKWTLHDLSSWAGRFQPDEEVSSNQLNGWFIKLVPRGLATVDEFRASPCIVVSNERLPQWATVEVTMNNKRRLAHLRDFVSVDEDGANELVIQVQPYALPRVHVSGFSATWSLDRGLFDAMREVRSEPFKVLSCEYQLLVAKLNDYVSVFVLATNAPTNMELGFTVSCADIRVSKTYHFGTSRGIGYPRLCPWPTSGNIEIRFCVIMYPIPPVVLSGYKDGKCHKARWVIPNAREVADRIQLNDEVRSSFFFLLGTRWQLCLGLREMYYAETVADPNLWNTAPEGAVAVYLGSESASSALFMLSLGPRRGHLVNTLPMVLTWTPGQVWGFKNIASPESILSLSNDGSLTVTLEIFGIPTADNLSFILPSPRRVAPSIRDTNDASGRCPAACSTLPRNRSRADSKDSGIVLYDPQRPGGATFDLDELAASDALACTQSAGAPARGCVVLISRGLQKLALLADQMSFFRMVLVWVDSCVVKKNGVEALIDILERKVEPFFKVKGAMGEDDLSTTMIDALNARFCEGRSNDHTTGEWRRNKFHQRQRLSITSPLRFGVFATAGSAINWVTSPAGPNFPVIVKPMEGSGSQFCTRCANPSDVYVAYDRALHQCTAELCVNDALLVEEFLQGTEYVINSVSFGSQYPARILEVWRKAQQYHDNYVLYDRQDLLKPADVPPILYSATRDILSALGAHYRASHLEVMVITRGDGELCVECVELNARAAGHASRTMPFDAQLPPYGTTDTRCENNNSPTSSLVSPATDTAMAGPPLSVCGVDNSSEGPAGGARDTGNAVVGEDMADSVKEETIVPVTVAGAPRPSRKTKRQQRRAAADAPQQQYSTGSSSGSDSTSNNSMAVSAATPSESWERDCDAFWRRFGVNQSSILVVNIVHPQAVVPPVPARPYLTAVFLRAPGKGALLSNGVKKICELPTFFGFDRDLAEFHLSVKLRDRNYCDFWPTSMDRVRNLDNTFLLTPSGRAQVVSFDVVTTNVEVKKTVDLFTVPGVVLLQSWDGWEAINADYDRIRAMERDGDLYAIEGSFVPLPATTPLKDLVTPDPELIFPPRGDTPPRKDAVPAGADAIPAGDDAMPAGDDAMPAGDDAMPAGDDAILVGNDAIPAGNDTIPAGNDDAPVGNDDAPVGDGDARPIGLMGNSGTSTKSSTPLIALSTPCPPMQRSRTPTQRNNQEEAAPSSPSTDSGNTASTFRTYGLRNCGMKDRQRTPVSPSPADKAFLAARRKNERLYHLSQPSGTDHRFAPPKRIPLTNQRSCFPYPKRQHQARPKEDAAMEGTSDTSYAPLSRKDYRRLSASSEDGTSISSSGGTQPAIRTAAGVRAGMKGARGEGQCAQKVNRKNPIGGTNNAGAVAGAAEGDTSRRKRAPKRRHVEGK
eukprot:GEMP01000525.1.p1 GENE.GEMP01000525.1~~GEMP01000525.1.p1  ORF type:complete len:1547 (+),score=409.77 GEMP01000525.1:312-4952(+)